MNRGSQPVGDAYAEDVRASMRPRFMNRGSMATHACESRPPAGFNEAPIHESGK